MDRIPVKENADIGTRRLLRSPGPPPVTNAMGPPSRRLRLPDEGGGDDGAEFPEDRSEKPPIAYQEVRRCHCAVADDVDEVSYCPLPADHCSVWKRQQSVFGSIPDRVECFTAGDWKVGFARHIWFYLCFAWLLLLLFPFFSRPGQNATRYLLSKCFPPMNPWIAEHWLRTETEARDLISEEFELYSRLKRQREGWISGYRIKTKLRDVTAERGGERDVDEMEKECGEENCTICITAVEDGDRVADLSCGHVFHADCLSEWILNKNSCPLCQGPVAREIRSFYDSSEDVAGDRAGSMSVTSRWRRQIRDGLLDVATGRDRRTHAIHHNRVRDMLNGAMEV